MLIPVSTDRPMRRTPMVSYVLIGLNIGVFIMARMMDRADHAGWEQTLERLMLDGPHLRERWWTPLTSMFLHYSAGHLFGNMLALFVFGPNIEDRFGRLWYLLFYLVGGLAAAGLHVA